jgi:hypothetical protein
VLSENFLNFLFSRKAGPGEGDRSLNIFEFLNMSFDNFDFFARVTAEHNQLNSIFDYANKIYKSKNSDRMLRNLK